MTRKNMKTINTKPCICVNTNKEIDCSECVQPIQDRDIERNGCNHIPMTIGSVLKKCDSKLVAQRRAIKTELDCKCGNKIKVPHFQRKVYCAKCKGKWLNNKGKWEFTKTKVISCDCGNTIPVGNHDVEKKCFNCNHFWNKNGKDWEKQQFVIHKDTMTIGDLTFKVRKKK